MISIAAEKTFFKNPVSIPNKHSQQIRNRRERLQFDEGHL